MGMLCRIAIKNARNIKKKKKRQYSSREVMFEQKQILLVIILSIHVKDLFI